VWHKKLEKQILEGVDPRELGLKAERARQAEREVRPALSFHAPSHAPQLEIEKVKRRREERAAEKEAQAAEQEALERERALVDAGELERKEEDFHLRQTRVRAAIRLAEGRPRPVDLLASNLCFFEALQEWREAPPGSAAARARPAFNFRLQPDALLDGLSGAELAELEEDAMSLARLEAPRPQRAQFWAALARVCAAEREAASRRDAAASAAAEPGMHASLDGDVTALLAGKSYSQLAELSAEVHSSLASGAAEEPEFWQAVAARCGAALARALVREQHAALRERALAEAEGGAGGVREALGWEEGPPAAQGSPEREPPPAAPAPARDAAASDGRFSPPRLGGLGREEAGLERVDDAEAERAALAAARAAVLRAARAAPAAEGDGGYRASAARRAGGGGEEAAEEAAARELRAAASRAMGDNADGEEVPFAGEVEAEARVYWWHDKYRPRKPKYFNRVHTGYEWNKYNQTHYDHDNPPPKVVQGYKFNIFYPDLIDPGKAPQFSILPDGSPAGETCILRFSAGPPYEDLAFRIVNKQWEYGHKRGYKSTFERGILHLHFNFERPRYRR